MELSLPVLVNIKKRPGTRHRVCETQLLFNRSIATRDESLQRALMRLVRSIKKDCVSLASDWDHSPFSAFAYNPDLDTHRVRLDLDLRDRTARFKIFLVSIKHFDRRLVFAPAEPSIWFEVTIAEDITRRANEVFEHYCRAQIKNTDGEFDPMILATHHETFVTMVDVDLPVDQVSREESERKFASLWSSDEMNGNTELHNVGRCLDHAYPSDLATAICRDDDVGKIEQLLQNNDRRPLLLVGPSLCGKTAIIHEVVRRRVEASEKQKASSKKKNGNVWLLGPQRIVSGMSYVGQWENRCLAIFAEAKKRNHILYFDDLLGLFRAGQASGSDLCVADLLKNAIHNQQFQVIAEITSEGYDKLTEVDRAFADLFYVHRVFPTDEETTTRISIEVIRQQEFKQKAIFQIDALPTILQLQRQYVRDSVFPGKASQFIQQLAVKYHHSRISRHEVLTEFCQATGVSMSLIDDGGRLDSKISRNRLRRYLVGQDRAVEACADVLAIAKAGLNAPTKPLATMLFLGPTGVGKTECAKALARLMYSSTDNLIRFDLNEFKSSHAAARLVGTFDESEGLLTRAVRQQPFAVVLFDEIEKGHPDVYDILLQVTGEGRLTDARGRTTDFTNTVIVMTSNLGTRSKSNTGFAGESAAASQHRYVKAAQDFFRPEFFNRIDQVIPFSTLTREEIEMIGEQMMQSVISREGLVRRRCVLEVEPDCVRAVCQKGFEPELGARALKRAIETHFTQPVASHLAAIQYELPTLIRVRPSAKVDDNFDISVQPLNNVDSVPRLIDNVTRSEIIPVVKSFMERTQDELSASKPEGGVSSDGIAPEMLRYYSLMEHMDRIRDQLQEMQNKVDANRDAMAPVALPVTGDRIRSSRRIRRPNSMANYRENRFLKELASVRDIKSFVSEVVGKHHNATNDVLPDIAKIVGECALLEALQHDSSDQCYFAFQMYGSSTMRSNTLVPQVLRRGTAVQKLLSNEFGFSTQRVYYSGNDQHFVFLMKVEGVGSKTILKYETGAHLFCDESGQISLIRSGPVTLCEPVDEQKLFDADNDDVQPPVRFVSPEDVLEVYRIYDSHSKTVDVRTGKVFDSFPTGNELRELLMQSLTAPTEFQHLLVDEITEEETTATHSEMNRE